MRIKYYPDTDTLNITLARTPYEGVKGEDTNDSDITLLCDSANRLAEIEIENASRRVEKDELRRMLSFEEIRPPTEVVS